jgi:hypothetical protein
LFPLPEEIVIGGVEEGKYVHIPRVRGVGKEDGEGPKVTPLTPKIFKRDSPPDPNPKIFKEGKTQNFQEGGHKILTRGKGEDFQDPKPPKVFGLGDP